MNRVFLHALALVMGVMLLGCSPAGPPSSGQTTDTSTAPSSSGSSSGPSSSSAPSSAPTRGSSSSMPSTAPTTPAPSQDPELASQLKALIVGELPALSLYQSTNVAADCGVDAGGCYVPEKAAIYVAKDRTDFRRPELLAHEYLHWTWQEHDLASDSSLIDALKQLAKNDQGLGALVPPWQTQYKGPDGQVEPSELFAYACTGLRAEQMSGRVGERCSEFLNLAALPVAQSVSITDLLDGVDASRQAGGQAPLKRNSSAAAASEARADLFTPESQTPLDEFPESVSRHFGASCPKPTYAVVLIRPSDTENLVTRFDTLLKGQVIGGGATGIGAATQRFDYINATKLFGDRALKVNATLVVVTLCR